MSNREQKSALSPKQVQALGQHPIEALIWALRHREAWPEGFEWNYGGTNQCAMGLAVELWPEEVRYCCVSEIAEVMNLEHDVLYPIFLLQPMCWPKPTTPEDIAKLLEEVIQ